MAMAVGTLCGLVNGFFVTKVKVHPLIVTLATMSAFRGLAEGDQPALTPLRCPTPTTPSICWPRIRCTGICLRGRSFMGMRDPNLPWFAIQAAGSVVFWAAIGYGLVLWKTPFGRTLYAIGHNEDGGQLVLRAAGGTGEDDHLRAHQG